MHIAKGLPFFGLLILFYPAPVALVATASLRLRLRWGEARRMLLISGALALPQAWIVLFARSGLLGAMLPRPVLALTLLLTMGSLLAWSRAARRGEMGHFWLEPLLLLAAGGWELWAVPGWIAH